MKQIQIAAIEAPLGKWYYRMEAGGILFPTYFESCYTTGGITPVFFVMDKYLDAVRLQVVNDEFLVFDTEHRCIEVFLNEQWDRGHYMHHWDLSNPRHRELFNIFMESYAHIIMKEPNSGANKTYIRMDKELDHYKGK